MDTKKETVIHAGFPKCASTFLQKQIFPKLKTYQYADGAPYYKLGSVYLEDIEKDNPAKKLAGRNNLIISLEDFMHYDLPLAWRRYGDWVRKDIFISNIKSIFREKGKLIFVIRRQDSTIESWLKYEPFFKKGEYFFLDYPMTGTVLNEHYKEHKGRNYGYDVKIYKKAYPVNRYGKTYTHTFDYFDIFKRIAAGVDKKRICILLFEDLKENKTRFYKQLGDFLGEDLSRFVDTEIPLENVSKNTAEIRSPLVESNLAPFSRWAPYFARKFFRRFFSEKSTLDENFRKDIMRLYADGNRRLARDFNLDLEKYGYF